MSCLLCDSDHRTTRVEFELNGVRYTRPAAYCPQRGYFISLQPPIVGIGVNTLVLDVDEVKEIEEKEPVRQEEPKFWEQP